MRRKSRASQDANDLLKASREIVSSMQTIQSGITSLAASAGKFEAILANDAQHPTLSTPMAERAFELIGLIDGAYGQLAEHFSERAKAVLELAGQSG